MSIRSITSWVSSFATIVRPSGERNASSAANDWPAGTAPATEVGNRHQIFPVRSIASRRPLPRSAMRKPPGKPEPTDEADDGIGDGLATGSGPGDPDGLPDGLPDAVVDVAPAATGAIVDGLTTPWPQAATASRITPRASARTGRGRRFGRRGSCM